MVKAGQALYQIDPSSYRATFNEAAASLKQAQALVIADCQSPATRCWSKITASPVRTPMTR